MTSKLKAIGVAGASLGALLATAGAAWADVLVNNNAGSTGTAYFTQSESAMTVFGSTIVIGYNDSGSNAGGTNRFTGWSISTDGGATFTDRGSLPASSGGDAGDPVLARNGTTGTIYFSTIGYSSAHVQVFRSFDNGMTFVAPVDATPGARTFDKPHMAVDNFSGAGNGNVYVVGREFGTSPGMYVYRSTDGGATFGPAGGVNITTSGQGGWVTVGPDHSVYAYWYEAFGTKLMMSRSTDGGITFAAPVTVTDLSPVLGTNGDLGLTGVRQGTVSAAPFRTNAFPQVAVSPTTGEIFVVFNDDPVGLDKGDIYLVTSTDNGATWSARVRVNSDATLNDQFFPTIAITPDGQHLGMFWYDRRNGANNLIEYYGDICSIVGIVVSCGADFAVSDVAFLPEFGRDSVVNSVYMSDYEIAQADNDFFYVTWSDNRLNLLGGDPRKDPNVFFDKIAIEAQGVPEPSTLAILSLGLAGLAASRRRKQ